LFTLGALLRKSGIMDIQVKDKISSILIEKLGLAETELTADANFIKDLGIDSLDYAELIMEFEQAFEIKIPDSDAEQLETIGQAIKYIESKM
jgi:acyl carrier protein